MTEARSPGDVRGGVPASTRIRVLVLAPEPGEHGGIGRATRTLLRALTDLLGHRQVGILPLWAPPDPSALRGHLLSPGVDKGDRRRVPIRVRVRYLVDAARAVWRSPSPVLVIVAHAHLAPVAGVIARLGDHQYVVWAHGDEVWGRMSRLVTASLRNADALWAVSDFTAERLRDKGLGDDTRIEVLRHALPPEVDLDAHAGSREGPQVLSVAALDSTRRYKGIDTLLNAWPLILARVPGARLVVVGNGDDRPRLEGLAAKHDVTKSVTFAGRVSDARLAKAYSSATVFALPARAKLGPCSKGEGFGLVLVEAAAAGLPVVAGRAGGATEAVRNGQTGFLVDPEDHGKVASTITALLTDPELAQNMGEAGRRWVRERFSYRRFRRDVSRLINTVDPALKFRDKDEVTEEPAPRSRSTGADR